MDRRALNRNTLPFIDLHQERRAQQRRRAALNTKRLAGIAALALIQGVFLLPATMQAVSFRPKIARAERGLTEADSRLQTAAKARAALEPALKKWERYQKSRAARAQIARDFAAIAHDLPRNAYIERLQADVLDKQTHLQIQGIARTQDDLRDTLKALNALPEFSGLHLIEAGDILLAGRHEIRFRAEANRE